MSNRLKSNIFFILSIICSVGVPVFAIAIKYKLFEAFAKAPTKVQISLTAVILIALVILFNLKKINEYIRSDPFSIYKCIINGLIKCLPIIAILYLILNINQYLKDIRFVVEIITICSLIDNFAFNPLYHYYKNEHSYDVEYKQQYKRRKNE